MWEKTHVTTLSVMWGDVYIALYGKPQEPESYQRGHTVTLTASHTNSTQSRKRAEGHQPGAAKCWSPSTRWQRA